MIAFASAIFISAFLIFQVQPLLGKYILPWFGGTPAVWTTCMLFFQALLLGGYAYAHLSIRKFSPRSQFIVHACLLGLSLVFLPIEPNAALRPHGDEAPAWHILMLLAATVGLPYLALSATGPLLQAWFSRAYVGRSPYALYALSNIGSLLGLLSFPFLFEPMWGRREQAVGWSIAFVVFGVLCAFCAWMAWKRATPASIISSQPQSASEDTVPSLLTKALWVALPALASTLLLATTNQICVDVASIPFLWVLPLCLYLISFIITFGKTTIWRWIYFGYWRWLYIAGLVLTLALVPAVLAAGPDASLKSQVGNAAGWLLGSENTGMEFGRWVDSLFGGVSSIVWQVGVWAALLFFACMVLHGELYQLKPAPRRLTSFYLAISAGGAMGGLFVAVIAPMIFNMYLEVHVALVATGVLVIACLWLDKNHWMHLTPAGLLRLLKRGGNGGDEPVWMRIRYGHLLFMPLISAVVVLGGELHRQTEKYMDNVLHAGRNFYGVLRVKEWGDGRYAQITLTHGVIMHGMQFAAPDLRRRPTTYYGEESGVGLALRYFPRKHGQRVGLVGLGAGTLAVYGKPRDYYRFYEINPEVLKLARRYFTYLRDCEARYDVIMGDARLQMEHEAERKNFQRFDVLALDAFSSDAIPVHLLTKEAFDVYFKHLAEDGVLAVHISNRHLDLKPVVFGLAREFKAHAVSINNYSGSDGVSASNWVLVTRNENFVDLQPIKDATADTSDVNPDAIRLWTDDFSNLLQVMTK